jgi:hypothetical protein
MTSAVALEETAPVGRGSARVDEVLRTARRLRANAVAGLHRALDSGLYRHELRHLDDSTLDSIGLRRERGPLPRA